MIRPPSLMRNLSRAETEHFRCYGFVLLKGMIADEEVARLQWAMQFALDTLELSPASRDLTALAQTADSHAAGAAGAGETYPGPPCCGELGAALRRTGRRVLKDGRAEHLPRGRSLLDYNVSRRVPELRQLALDPDLPRMAATLLEVPSVRFYDDVLLAREAGAVERCAFHQDLSSLHIDGMRGCSFWIFVDPVRDGRAALGYVPSSHKWGEVFKPNFFLSDLPCPDSEGADMPAIDSAPEDFGVQYVSADPGDIIVHHMLTLFGGQGNRGAGPVRGFGLRYVDAAARFRRRAGVDLPPTYTAAPHDGATLDNWLHPVAWPRLERLASRAGARL